MSREITVVVDISFLGYAGHGTGHAVLPLVGGLTPWQYGVLINEVIAEATDKARKDSGELFSQVLDETNES